MEVKLSLWDGRTVHEQEVWVEKLFTLVKSTIACYGDPSISTCTALCATVLKNSYARGRVFPFVNIPIRYQEKELLGLYEYCDELPLSDQYIYCDFVIQSIYYADNKDSASINTLVERVRQYLQDRGFEVIHFIDGMAAIAIDRSILHNEQEFGRLLRVLLEEAVNIQQEIR